MWVQTLKNILHYKENHFKSALKVQSPTEKHVSVGMNHSELLIKKRVMNTFDAVSYASLLSSAEI